MSEIDLFEDLVLAFIKALEQNENKQFAFIKPIEFDSNPIYRFDGKKTWFLGFDHKKYGFLSLN